MRIARFFWAAFIALLLAGTGQWLFVAFWSNPQDRPWTALDLRAPIGRSTGRKLAALDRNPQLCRTLLEQAGVGFTRLPAFRGGLNCGWTDAVRLTAAARSAVPLSCPLAAAFDLWMRDVVQLAAADLLGSRVKRIETFGSYACRRINGAEQAAWSEHASANAIDVAGFRLADGRRITVARNWRKNDAHGAFLHRVRDGGCRLFATTLSPDYNAAHRDHLHLDMAARGRFGWSDCG